VGLAVRGALALGAVGVFVLVAVVWRIWLQRRWTGTSGVALHAASATRVERVSDGLYALVGLGLVAVPVAALFGRGLGGPAEVSTVVVVLALLVAAIGVSLTSWAQIVMGRSWRIGVDRDEATELVTHGPFRYVRNPIYSAMMLFVVAMGLLLPSPVLLVVIIAAVACAELQVRVIEEPFLVAQQGAPYETWAGSTGRFVPGIGRALSHSTSRQ
jgi:protein-S-isoprenylcysteine O-methyltransferase Ste14